MKVYIENKNYYFNDNFPNIPIGEFIIYMANADFAKNEHNQYKNPKIEKILSEFNENPQNYDNYSLICNEIIINGFTNFSLIESIVEKTKTLKTEFGIVNDKITFIFNVENLQQLIFLDILEWVKVKDFEHR
jgi:hypothetical protein